MILYVMCVHTLDDFLYVMCVHSTYMFMCICSYIFTYHYRELYLIWLISSYRNHQQTLSCHVDHDLFNMMWLIFDFNID